MGMNFSVFFSTGDTMIALSILIVNDNVFEPDEDFSLTLVIPQSTVEIGVISGVPLLATVIIEDDDGEYCW